MISKLFVQEIKTDDCKILRLADNSFYNPALPVTNGILEVTPPGYDCPVIFNVDQYFNVGLNSTTLKINTGMADSQLGALPDGVYAIKYSIKPNNSLFVEYDMLRNCQQVHQYINEICKLFTAKCDLTKKDFECKRTKLIWIRELIDAAKYKVDECGERKEGLALYNEATNLLKELNKNCC